MKVMVTPVSEQTLTNLSVQIRKGAWSGLPAGNDGFRAGVSSWRTQKTCFAAWKGRSTHPTFILRTHGAVLVISSHPGRSGERSQAAPLTSRLRIEGSSPRG